METNYSLPPNDETEIRDDMPTRTIPRSETTWLPSLSRSPAMSDVAPQSSAVVDLSNELERQRQIAEYERQQQETRQTRQLEVVRQEVVSELHSLTQSLTESHREDASTVISYANNLTENALNRLNKQSHEIQQMADNDERLTERTRQMITARENKLGNQAKEQESPDRAKPKAKSELQPTSIVEKLAVVDGENPEENHPPKGKRGRPSNNPEFKQKYQEGDFDQTPQNKKQKPHT